MPFTSPGFYLFVCLVLAGTLLTPGRVRVWILVVASYTFYGAAEPWYCLLLLFSTLVDYTAGLKIHASQSKVTRKRWLLLSLFLNLGLLALFKYGNFTLENLALLFGDGFLSDRVYLDLILPVGISFYTFQTLSYTIDIYRGRQEPTRDFVAFALYVAFFPQLVAGPIERARNLLAQLERPIRTTREDIEYGLQRILWGLAKKTIFADRFALVVNTVYHRPEAYSSPEVLLATLCFSFQLYLDFSAYSDIAIGLARLFGIRLSENFNYPFLARNPSDFWSRWHITLTSWFRDYLYTALGGTRRGAAVRTSFAILLTMSLMGLWHGAEWHFVMFGLLSGIMVVIYLHIRITSRRRSVLGDSRLATICSIVLMNIVINLIMVFFRAPTVNDAITVMVRMLWGGWSMDARFLFPSILLGLAMAWHIIAGSSGRRIHELPLRPVVRGAVIAVLFLCVNYLALDRSEQFIYFRF